MLKILLLFSIANAYILTPCSGIPRFAEAQKKIWQGNSAFTHNFLNLKLNESAESSFVASPFSVLIPLAQLALYANGTSHNQLSNVLNVDDSVELGGGYREILSSFKISGHVELSLAQRIYTNVSTELADNFKSDTKEYFDAEAQNVDFNKNEEAAALINKWVQNKTHGLISQIVDPKKLDKLTMMVLVNAIYFKGLWNYPFYPKNTEQKDFHLSPSNKVKVKMMYQENIFKYMENTDLQIKALQLPYKDRDYSLLVILPTSEADYSLKNVTQKVTDPQVFNGIIDDLRYFDVQVSLPSIKTSTETNLKTILEGVNVTEVFKPGNLDVGGILKDVKSIHVSVAIQKAVMIINEFGSEAAAGNYIEIRPIAPMPIPNPEKFNANRPFLYFIVFKNKNVLFCGTYNGN